MTVADEKQALRASQLALRDELARNAPDAGERAASVFPVGVRQTTRLAPGGAPALPLDRAPTSAATKKLTPQALEPGPMPGSPALALRDVAELVVAGTFPMKSELDPRPLMRRLEGQGARLALPRVVRRGQPLTFHAWTASTRFVESRFGVTEPAPETPVLEPDVLLVPLLAFDRTGARLGYGGGFYDITLATLRARRAVIAVGFAWAGLEVAAVPTEPHDQRLDAICTEREWIPLS